MLDVVEMTPGQAIKFALEVFLEQGFRSNYYADWKEFAAEEYGEDDQEYYEERYSLTERQGAWEAFEQQVDTSRSYLSGGITVKYEGSQSTGLAHGSSEYFIILSLEDHSGKRFFKRDGYYNSYEGGNLYDATDHEVFPESKTVTVWKDLV